MNYFVGLTPRLINSYDKVHSDAHKRAFMVGEPFFGNELKLAGTAGLSEAHVAFGVRAMACEAECSNAIILF